MADNRSNSKAAAGLPRSGRGFLLVLAAIAGAALLLRLGVWAELGAANGGRNAVYAPSALTDLATYMKLGREVASGEYRGPFYYQPFYYAVFLPVCYWLSGGSIGFVVFLQSLLGAATSFLAGLAGGRLFGKTAGYIAAGFVAISTPLLLYTPYHQNETLQTFNLTLLFYLAVLGCERWTLPRWAAYIWPELAYLPERNTPEQRRAALCDPAHPYSRCVWKCDNDQPDRQSVMIEFEDGSLATHSMIADTARPMRRIHVIGTEGEIEGVFDDNRFVVRHRDLRPGHEYGEEVVDTGDLGDTTGAYGDHGGGDLRLVEDFVNYSEGKPASLSCTALTDSLTGHLLVFAADEARLRKRRIDFTEFCKGITAIR